MWIKKSSEIEQTLMEEPKGGAGLLFSKEIQYGNHQINDNIVGYKMNTLPVGSGLGYHMHDKTSETIFILSGECKYTDNNKKETILKPGDAAYCGNGECHSIYANGNEQLVFMALIIKE